MITKFILEKIKPIKLSDGSILSDVTSETRTYLFGIRLYKYNYLQKIDVEIEPKDIKTKKVGFTKPT